MAGRFTAWVWERRIRRTEGQLARKKLQITQELEDASRASRHELRSALTGGEDDKLLRLVHDADVRRLRKTAEQRLRETERAARDRLDDLKLQRAAALGR